MAVSGGHNLHSRAPKHLIHLTCKWSQAIRSCLYSFRADNLYISAVYKYIGRGEHFEQDYQMFFTL